MPQLNFNDFAPQIIWLAITFSILYLLMARLALPRVGRVIEERRNRIEGDLSQARLAQEKAEKASADYDAALAAAKGQAQAKIRAVREKLDRELGDERSQAERQIAQKTVAAEREIAENIDKAMANISVIAAETAGDIVRQVSGLEVSQTEVGDTVRNLAGEGGKASS